MTSGIPKQINLRALVCSDVTTDLIIGLPSIQFFNLLPILQSNLNTRVWCEICPIAKGDRTRNRTPHRDMVATRSDTGRRIAAKELPAQHLGYTGEMQTLFAEINAVTDNGATPTYTNTDDMIQALQGLHISELLGFEDNGADEEGPNDIDTPLRRYRATQRTTPWAARKNYKRRSAR